MNKISRVCNKPILSIIIPVYNTAKFIPQCLNSITRSRYLDQLEIIIINDGSTDNSQKIIEKYQSKLPQIKYIYQKNSGHGSVINRGVKLATGQYFKLLDSDDFLNTKSLDKHIDYLCQSTSDMVFTNFNLIQNSKIISKIRYNNIIKNHSNIFQAFSRQINPPPQHNYIQMHAITYKTSLLKKSHLRCLKNSFYVDQQYITQTLAHINTVSFQNIDLYQYRIGQNHQSVASSQMQKNIKQYINILNTITQYYQNHKTHLNKDKKNYYQIIIFCQLYNTIKILKSLNKNIFEIIKLTSKLLYLNPVKYSQIICQNNNEFV